ncbi:MAG: fimbrillin family protein [Bacteroidales bacterium]|nr:fimbrillin family protein [Bacteroidales bacterium]
MKKYLTLFFAAALFLLASCQREKRSFDEILDEKRAPVEFTASLGAFSTKATDSSFGDGDVIGIFALNPIDAYNVRAVVSASGAVSPQSPVRWELVETVDFMAYHPYNANLSEPGYSFSVNTDQTKYENYRASDISTASMTAEYGSKVNLEFSHRLSRLTVDAACDDPSDEVVAVTLGKLVVNVEVDMEAASASAGTKTDFIKAGKAVSGNGNVGYVAILVPQKINLPIEIRTRKGYVVTATLDTPANFEGGFAYRTSLIRIPAGDITNPVSFSVTVADWDDDGILVFNTQ